MSATPPPRPALRKAPDRTVHPAAPRLAVPSADLHDAATPRGAGKGEKGGKGTKGGAKVPEPGEKTVELVVALPKSMRKRVRAKAEAHGLSAEEAAYHLLRVWLDG